jgi:hypothetical protein
MYEQFLINELKLKVLGEGHFGKVYQGTMNILGRTIDVAWKVSNSKENANVFLNEIKLWLSLQTQTSPHSCGFPATANLLSMVPHSLPNFF